MAENEPLAALAAGRQVTCAHCGQIWFWQRQVVMSSSTASFFGVEAFSPEATVLTCTGCGKMQLFAPRALQFRRPAQ